MVTKMFLFTQLVYFSTTHRKEQPFKQGAFVLYSTSLAKKHTFIPVRELIIKLSVQELSYKKISQQTNKPDSTDQSIIRRYKEEGKIHDKPKTGRSNILDERQERIIVRKSRRTLALVLPK